MQNAAQTNIESQATFNPSEEQMDKFFATGGKEDVFKEAANEDREPVNEAAIAEKEEVEKPFIEAKPIEIKTEVEKKEEHERNVHKALHEERERRRDMQRKLEDLEQHKQKMEHRFQEFIEKAKAPQETPPSFDEDPLSALRYDNNKVKEEINRINQIEMQRVRQSEAYNEHQKFVNKYHTDAGVFSQSTPDFDKAYQHVISARFKDLKTLGYNNEEADYILKDEEVKVVQKAYRDGVNPAERIYALAKERGYQQAQSKVEQEQKKAAEPDQKKFETIEKGVKHSKSLSNGSGSRLDKGLTLEALSEMDEDEFNSISPKEWNKLMQKHS